MSLITRIRSLISVVGVLLVTASVLLAVPTPAHSQSSESFVDLKPGDPFYEEISWLASEGISTGYKDDSFRRREPVNRDAMAAFMYRFADVSAYQEPAKSQFKDVAPGDPFYKEISWLASEGISTGYKDDTFRRREPVNRDAMAAFMYRYADILEETEPSPSLTLSEQRAVLRDETRAAKQEYVDSRPYISLLARADGLTVKKAIEEGIASLEQAADLVTAAYTQAAMTAAAQAIRDENLRASTVYTSAGQLKKLKDLRDVQQDVAMEALSDLNSGRINASTYRATKASAGAFSTQLAVDAANQRKVIGKVLQPIRLRAPGWTDELKNGSNTIPIASGWVGFAGGCALPRAASSFTPNLPTTGPGIATNSQLIADANRRGGSDPTLTEIHAQMLRASSHQTSVTLSLDQLRGNYAARVARVGYGWLQDGNTAARDTLRAEAKRVLEAGPESMNTLTASHLLLAAATASDWSSASGMEETVLIRWVGPQTCLHADQENFVDASTNIAAIHNSATFVSAAVFLEDSPAQAAALARESLVSIQPTLRMITTDGGTREGPGYWSYQSRAISTLYSTLPNVYSSVPITMPSLTEVSKYALHSTGPDGLPTPFADAQPNELLPWMPAWDAYSRNDSTVAAWVAQEMQEKPDPYLMWWWTKPGTLPVKRSAVFPHTGLAVLHMPSSSSPGTATLKGGDNSANHAHLDLGTVSFHRRGVQWAIDPGSETDSPSGYYGDTTRWSYWKPSTAAHSTLTIDGANQPVRAKAPTSMLSSSSALVNMVQALPGTSSATRTITHSSTSMVIKDVVRANKALPLTWQWVTDASVSVDSNLNRATLRKNGERVTIRFDGAPSGSKLITVSAPRPGPDGQRLTVVKLVMPKVTSLNLKTTVW